MGPSILNNPATISSDSQNRRALEDLEEAPVFFVVSRNQGSNFGSSCNKDYGLVGSLLGSLCTMETPIWEPPELLRKKKKLST